METALAASTLCKGTQWQAKKGYFNTFLAAGFAFGFTCVTGLMQARDGPTKSLSSEARNLTVPSAISVFGWFLKLFQFFDHLNYSLLSTLHCPCSAECEGIPSEIYNRLCTHNLLCTVRIVASTVCTILFSDQWRRDRHFRVRTCCYCWCHWC